MPEQRLQFKELFKLSIRTFRVKPVRAILTIAGMSVGIGAVMFLVSLGYGLQYILIGKLVSTEDSLIAMEIGYPSETGKVINETILNDLKNIPLASEVSPVYEFAGELGQATSSGLLVDSRIVTEDYFRLTGFTVDVGDKDFDKADGKGGIIISSQAIKAIGLSADSTSLNKPLSFKVFYDDETLVTVEATSTKILIVSGIILDDSLPPTVLVSADHLSKKPPFTRKAIVKAKDIDSVEGVRDELINRGFLVSARIDLVNQARKITNAITIVLGVFGVTALIVSAIGMFNTMIVGFLERIYEVGILKSIGATDTDVRNLFLMESSIMGVLGGIGGITLGYSAGKFFNILLSLIATQLGGKAFELFITPLWFVLLVLVLSLFIGLISGFWPARRAANLSPKEAFIRK